MGRLMSTAIQADLSLHLLLLTASLAAQFLPRLLLFPCLLLLYRLAQIIPDTTLP